MSFPAPAEYGHSQGGFREVPLGLASLKLRHGGLNFSVGPHDLGEGETPDCVDVRLDFGGVTPEYGQTAFDAASGSAADKNIMHLAPFEIAAGTKFVMRLRPTRWDRWNGSNWFELPGLLTGTTLDRLYSLAFGDNFVAANGIDRLKRWDGNDLTAVADLSADAPIAFYITKVGSRILAARIKVGATIFPYDLKWCADGIITNWTSAASGAGGVTLQPEGSSESSNIITGLSTLAGAGVIYRQRTITLALQTGLGAAPFKFYTIDFGHGTYSPWSINRGGMNAGDYFLGDDYMVYYFDGRSMPIPIGEPIFDILRTSIYDPKYVVGAVTRRTQTYVLAIPTDSSLLLKQAYVFSIREWVKNNRLVWWKRDLGAGYRTIGYAQVPTGTDPIVDTVSSIVDTVSTRVDDFAITPGDERLVLGDTAGQAYYQDLTKTLGSGIWRSKPIGDGQTIFTLGRVRLSAKVRSTSVVEVAVSSDGGITFNNPILYNFTLGGQGEKLLSDYFGIDSVDAQGNAAYLQFQIRILSGDITVNEIAYVLDNHGRAN